MRNTYSVLEYTMRKEMRKSQLLHETLTEYR